MEEIKKDPFEPLTTRENYLAKVVVDIAFKIHKALGPGLMESVYEKCFCYKLDQLGIAFRHQQLIPVKYEQMIIENALKIDILVEHLLVLELKAPDNYHPVWDAQILSYLKLIEKRIGYLINFHVPLMKQGFKRFVL